MGGVSLSLDSKRKVEDEYTLPVNTEGGVFLGSGSVRAGCMGKRVWFLESPKSVQKGELAKKLGRRGGELWAGA